MFPPGHVTHWNRENVCVRLSRGAIDILQPAIFDRRWWKATPSIEHLGQWCISLRRNSRREASRWEIYLSLATGGGCHGDASRRIRLPLLLFVKMKTCGIRLLQLIYWSACQTARNDFSFFSNEAADLIWMRRFVHLIGCRFFPIFKSMEMNKMFL